MRPQPKRLDALGSEAELALRACPQISAEAPSCVSRRLVISGSAELDDRELLVPMDVAHVELELLAAPDGGGA